MITVTNISDIPDNAVDIVFVSDAQINVFFASDIEVAGPQLIAAKRNKIMALNAACKAAITGGFMSSALGAEHEYSSDVEDQTNLIGAAQANIDMLYRCKAAGETARTAKAHTASQIKQVFADGVAYKHTQIIKLDTLKQQVEAATSQSGVGAIVW